ncbi:MAG: hypothetical protein E7353_00375 [Clostridiales bacterium]|nr:hypothetical protein [Clostridiales bacterium]
MKKKLQIITILCVVLLLIILLSCTTAYAYENIEIEDLLSKINLEEIEKLFNDLSKEEQSLLGGSFKNLITNLTNGTNVAVENVTPYIFSLILSAIKEVLPSFTLLIIVIIVTSLLKGIKANFAHKAIHEVINFASACIVGAILCYSLISIVTQSYQLVKKIFSLVQIIFPIIFSILITMGASTSASIFQGCITLFLSLISFLINSFIMPIIIASCILSVITNISTSLNLGKIPDFLVNTGKKTINLTFIGFSSLITIQGISAQVYDSVGIRIAKFSLSKYIPILGGYLSTGFDFLYTGSVLLKNSVGVAFLFILIITILPTILKLLCFSFLIELLSVISSCVGNGCVVKMMEGIKKCISLAITCIVGLSLTLSVFTVMTVLSFNSLA